MHGGSASCRVNAIDSAGTTSQVKHQISGPSVRETSTVAKPELGTKRLCANCGTKFYDLSKNPAVCPKCATVIPVAAPTRARPDAAAAAAAAVAAAAAAAAARPSAKVAVVEPETADAEFVSLEEADAE